MKTKSLNWTRVSGGVGEWTENELRMAFAKVQDRNNWKSPIPLQQIPFAELAVTCEAIRFFCGSETYIGSTNADPWIKADGYYISIGS